MVTRSPCAFFTGSLSLEGVWSFPRGFSHVVVLFVFTSNIVATHAFSEAPLPWCMALLCIGVAAKMVVAGVCCHHLGCATAC